ncbi:MAG: CsgG/HfaB family protein [bacterium]|nr:CsgG/HfaB family protein [bacterium]
MNNHNSFLKLNRPVLLGKAIVLFSLFPLQGCSLASDRVPLQDMVTQEAKLTVVTSTQKALLELPPAAEMLTASVYNFEDYTGQNKPAETPQYSKAVTQGGVPILKQALVDAGNHKWFRVLERGGLEHLLQERNIIRSVRETYVDADGSRLPPPAPLLYSGLLLEGGIVGYDSNTLTGGAGARYLGIGGSTEYRRDIVTVYLRAVSVMSGEVMLSVSTSKTLVSTKVSGGIYKFVSFDKLLEAETGFSVNEPSQLAVRQAVEMAVYAMIMEGAAQDLWKFADNNRARELYHDYLAANDRTGSDEAFAINLPSYPAPMVDSQAPAPVVSAVGERANKVSQAPEVSQPVKSSSSKVSDTPIATPKTVRPRVVKPIADDEIKVASSVPVKKGAKYLEMFQMAGDKVRSGYYIQIGVYRPFDSWGQEMLEKVDRSGHAFVLQKARIDSVDYVRLLMGPFASRQDCVRTLGKVAGQFGSGLFIKYVSADGRN